MAREVLVRTWCDPCLANDQHVEGTELPPLRLPEVPGNKPRLVALCEVHRKEVYDPLVQMLTEYGQTVDAVDAGPKPKARSSAQRGTGREALFASPSETVCPVCGFESTNKSALQSHTRHIHRKTLAELLGQDEYPCPECDYRAANPQGLGAHRRAIHGVRGSSKTARASNSDDAPIPTEAG